VEDITLFAQLGGVFDRGGITSKSSACCLAGAGTEVLINLRTTPGGIDYELGLGTSFLRGFTSRVEGLDFRGSVRSFPSVSLYLSGQRLGTDRLRGYLGGTFGFSELWNARAFDADGTRYAVSAQTLELGASAGVYLAGGFLDGLFAEAAYRHRHFPSVDWGDDGAGVPGDWPRALDLSGAVFSLGYQFSVRGGDDDGGGSGVAGIWLGERLDGTELPALYQGAGPEQTELVGATLTFVRGAGAEGSAADGGDAEEHGTYELVLLKRVSRVAVGGATTTSPPAEPERGRYLVRGGTVQLQPSPDRTHTAVIDDQHLHLRLAGTSHLLTLRRARH
jgi:hypothetical protein